MACVPFDLATGGTATIITCTGPGYSIVVLGYRASGPTATSITWQYQISPASPVTIDGPHWLPGGGPPMVVPESEEPCFFLPAGANLVLACGGSTEVGGGVTYAMRQND